MTLKLTDHAPQIWGENLPFWFVVLARLASLFLMITGLLYWVGLIGAFGVSSLEANDWRIAAMHVLLACSFLIASVGVWQLTFWGVVMWGLSAIAQTTAIIWFEDFVFQPAAVSFLHLLALVALAVSCGVIYMKARRHQAE
ncbi:hypothetical protein SAMN04515647_3355 [Cohaesibacter sp. ES.047]|uniref:hypothetical protein n=1 Tax=Cohaesibacter sp. ES.047 TaxID=1798205 RepID=UPI000BB7C667|nr:hypothetical protein [Cohaesibacter sp. ES.047]SNY93082.1 hypothetical protein SAMN04515647_3355 [Cohaesibacter sp. ES.047]